MPYLSISNYLSLWSSLSFSKSAISLSFSVTLYSDIHQQQSKWGKATDFDAIFRTEQNKTRTGECLIIISLFLSTSFHPTHVLSWTIKLNWISSQVLSQSKECFPAISTWQRHIDQDTNIKIRSVGPVDLFVNFRESTTVYTLKHSVPRSTATFPHERTAATMVLVRYTR